MTNVLGAESLRFNVEVKHVAFMALNREER
jgi:hypothetical protein